MPPRMLFSSVGDVLAVLARRYGLQTRLFESNLAERWTEVAGEAIAAHTRPDGIRFKRLYVLVENSVWLQQLTYFKPALLEKINTAAGKPLVTDIVLRIGDVTSMPPDHASDPTPATAAAAIADPDATKLAAVYTEQVTDPVLRTRLESLMAKAWARAARQVRDSSR